MRRLLAAWLLLFAPILSAQETKTLTRGLADALYCKVAGNCTVQNFTITGTCTGCGGAGTVTSVGNGTIGSLFTASWANATTTPALSLDITNQGTTITVLHGNAAGHPTFGSVVSADLNITGTTCTNQVLTVISSAAAGTCTTITSAFTTGTFSPSAHNLLSSAHGDTTAAAAVRGDGLFAIGATPTWQRLAHPSTTGGYFKWNGTDIVASTGAASGTGACTNQAVTASNADAAPTCTTITSAYVDSSVATVGSVNAFTGANTFAADQTLGAANCLKWGSSGVATPDTFLCRDAANNPALKNSTTAQTLTIYGTTTGPKTLTLGHNGTDGFVTVNGSGTPNLVLTAPLGINFAADGLGAVWGIGTAVGSGELSPTSDNLRNVGTTTQRVAHVYGHQFLGGTESGTNTAGTNLTVASDTGTGNTTPTRTHLQSPASGTGSGTTVHTLIDRLILNATKSLSNNTTTTVCNVTDASDTAAAVIVSYAVEVNDGASHHQQTEVGSVACSVVNANGTISGNTCTKYGNQQSISASGGTLTVTWTITAANPALLQINSNTGTITPSLIRVTYSIQNLTQQAVAIQ